jgi:glucose/arabinose dehydrogenase
VTFRAPLAAAATALAALVLAAPASAVDPISGGGLTLNPVGDFTRPLQVATAPGDPSRVFVVEQGSTSGAHSEIVVVKDGVKLATPFLDLDALTTKSDEQGLLSLAFAPDYATSGHFFVYFTSQVCPAPPGCTEELDEYTRATADTADPASRRTVLTIPHPTNTNHNGGRLQFGPDGYLYLSVGDGGSGNDPPNNAQNLGVLLGKLLRIDPNPTSGGAPYGIPPGNPFVGTPGALPEIYAYGLRNAFRYSFDDLTGDLLIGDVGQSLVEEWDFAAHADGDAIGRNFGWRIYEGDRYNTDVTSPIPAGTFPSGYLGPVLTHTHADGYCGGIGGRVVRDQRLGEYRGRYVYSDLCEGEIRSAIMAASGATDDRASGLDVSQVDSIDEDDACRVYVVSILGGVWRLDPQTPTGVAAGCEPAPTTPGGATGPSGPAGPGPVIDRVAPLLRSVSLLRTRFPARRGTYFRLTSTEAGQLTLRIQRLTTGKRVAKACLAPTRARRKLHGCLRWIAVGVRTATARAGARTVVKFTARLGGRLLAPGSYRALITVRDTSANTSKVAVERFTVLRG